MKKKVIVILTAAGSGLRFFKSSKSNTPKQFVMLSGKPVILHSLIVFQKCRLIDEIYISASKKYFNFIHSLAIRNNISKLKGLVEGGRTRFVSVKNAFNQISAGINDLILIHDAARPNIDIVFIVKLIEAAYKYGEVIPGIKISETIKRTNKNIVQQTINRDNLRLIQTPQIFRYSILKKSYTKSKRNDFTDESAMVENCGYKVRIVEGKTGNIKITSSEDLQFLKKIM